MKNDGGRSRAGVRRHFSSQKGLTVVEREGLLVTDRIRTVLDLARRIRAVLRFADSGSGSAGESYSRALIHAAGFQAPVLQHKLVNADGLVGYADFYWKQSRVVGEFDGEGKYLNPEFLKGRTPAQAVIMEKNRENKIRSMGYDVVRWNWDDLMEPGKVERKLAEAGVPRRRTRSAVLEARTPP